MIRRVRWSLPAQQDLKRLRAFLADKNPPAANRLIKVLGAAPKRVIEMPRLGERLNEFDPAEVRRLVIGQHEMRYEITDTHIVALRIWHTREER